MIVSRLGCLFRKRKYLHRFTYAFNSEQLRNILSLFVVNGVDVAHGRLHGAVLELIHYDFE